MKVRKLNSKKGKAQFIKLIAAVHRLKTGKAFNFKKASFFFLLKLFYDRGVKLYKIYAFTLIFLVFSSHAIEIRFPDEELASETVLPLFDPVRTVLNRNISLKYRFELGAGAAFALDEPFHFYSYPTAFISFYFSEVHGVSVTGTWFPPDYSKSGEALRKGICDKKEGNSPCTQYKLFDVHRLPYPQLMGFLNYQYTPYYGKISLTKKLVMNLSIYGFAGPGLIAFNESTRLFAFNMGIGQRIYLFRHFALRTDLGFYAYYGPDPSKIKVFELVPPQELESKLRQPLTPILYNTITSEQKTLWMHLTATAGVVILL